MQNATKFLTADEQQHVEAAVREAEQQTSAEIVAVVTTESGRYDRAESIVGLLGAALALVVLNLFTSPQLEPGNWSATPAAAVSWQVLAVVLGFIAGSLLASYCHPIRRFFVQESELQQEVDSAARTVFTAQRLHSTRAAGGVLLYVSLFEHRTVVLTDDGVVEKLGADFARRLRDVAIEQLRSGRREATLLETVKAAAAELCGPLPAQSDDTDELPNHLVCIHPRP